MDGAPVYLEKIKGARLVFYRCTKRSCRTERVISALLLALFAKCIFYTWECATEDQFVSTTLVFLAPVLFFIVKAFRDGKTVITTCDHVQQHEDEWGNIVDQMDDGDGVIEAGTVVNWGLKYASGALKFNGVSMNQDGCSGTDKIVDHLIEVQWDCGHKQRYSKENKEWNLLRVFDMGPTGLKSHILLCDVCKEPLTGFSFRCTNKTCSDNKSQIYDLCYKHYNENHHHPDNNSHRFRVLQFQDIGLTENMDNLLKIRSNSRRFRLAGLFPKARIVCTNTKSSYEGEIIKVVHKGGHTVARKSKFWNCTAEFQCRKTDEIRYGDIGAQGKVVMKAVVAGDGSFIYADHFPSIGDKVLDAAIHNFHDNMFRLPNGDQYFISSEHGFRLLSITQTSLQHLNYDELWKKCDRLECLSLLDNKLKSLPPSLQHHHDTLKVATLSYNCFGEVPNVIFSFQHLINLNMIHNTISVIPKRLSHLKSLTCLYLSHNHIFSLPNSFLACENLSVLCLDNNMLSYIPTSIRKLPNLHSLELHHNNLLEFQVSTDEFKKLKLLSLHHNRLQVLPKTFQHLLNRLKTCSLHNNPFVNAKFCTKLSKFENCAKNKEIGRECIKFSARKRFRVLVIGGCGSGKTSIIQLLCKDKYVTPVENEKHDHTIGIEQHVHHFQSCESMFELSVWDFAGEDSYLMMNYMFFSESTLIWLVVNVSEYQGDPQSFQTMIGVWLRAVVARVNKPYVWIIGTHSDKCEAQDLKEKELTIYKYVAEECEIIKSTEDCDIVSEFVVSNNVEFDCSHVKVFMVSNTYARDGYSKLNEEIRNLPSSAILKLHDCLPSHWTLSHIHLKEMALKHFIVDESDIVHHIVTLNKDKSLTQESAMEILNYLHETGEVLIINDSQGEKKVFLDVMQLIYILKQIFRHDLCENIANMLKMSREYDHRSQKHAIQLVNKHGIISKDLIMKLWSPLGIVEEDKRLLLDLLVKSKMAYETVRDGEKCYLFPFLLNPCHHLSSRSVSTRNVIVRCEFGFIPCGIFESLLCCSLPYFVGGYKIRRNMLQGLCNESQTLKLLIFCERSQNTNYSGTIEIHVEEINCYSAQASQSYSTLWTLALHVIRNLQKLISEWRKLRVSMVVPCPRCVQSKHYFPLVLPPKTASDKDFHCEHGDIEMESVVPPSELLPEDLNAEKVLKRACGSTHEVANPRVLAILSDAIGSDWKLCKNFDLLNEREINNIEHDYRDEGCKEMCAQMLLLWAKHRRSITTVSDLAKAIEGSKSRPISWIIALKSTLAIDIYD